MSTSKELIQKAKQTILRAQETICRSRETLRVSREAQADRERGKRLKTAFGIR